MSVTLSLIDTIKILQMIECKGLLENCLTITVHYDYSGVCHFQRINVWLRGDMTICKVEQCTAQSGMQYIII